MEWLYTLTLPSAIGWHTVSEPTLYKAVKEGLITFEELGEINMLRYELRTQKINPKNATLFDAPLVVRAFPDVAVHSVGGGMFAAYVSIPDFASSTAEGETRTLRFCAQDRAWKVSVSADTVHITYVSNEPALARLRVRNVADADVYTAWNTWENGRSIEFPARTLQHDDRLDGSIILTFNS